MGVSKNRGGPRKSCILIRFSIINHPLGVKSPYFLGWHPHIYIYIYNTIKIMIWYFQPYQTTKPEKLSPVFSGDFGRKGLV